MSEADHTSVIRQRSKTIEYRKVWSRRIDHGNRLVYNIVDGNLWIASCRGHYEN